mgnify:CR=1 FL=1
MSEAYKQSAYCQLEAHYAFERGCHLIPLIMKQHYRPDGWLGIIISGKIYFDFPKLGFDFAYEQLRKTITPLRKDQDQSIISTEQLQTTISSMRTNSENSQNISSVVQQSIDK